MIKKSKKGFTLIEMIVVLIILSILVTGSMETYRSYRNQTRYSKARANLSYAMSQAEAFKVNTGFYIPNLQEMHISFTGILEFVYFINCIDENGNVAYGDGSKFCGTFSDREPLDATDSHFCCNDIDDAVYKDWMGVVLRTSYCGPVPDNATLSSKITQSKPRTYDVHSTGNLQLVDPCQDVLDALSTADTVPDFTALQTERNEKFKIAGSHEMCHSSRVLDGAELRSSGKNCAHSQEYTYFPSSGYEASLFDSNSHSFDDSSTDGISGPNYLILLAIGCKEREEDCASTHERVGLSLNSAGVMEDFDEIPPSSPSP